MEIYEKVINIQIFDNNFDEFINNRNKNNRFRSLYK